MKNIIKRSLGIITLGVIAAAIVTISVSPADATEVRACERGEVDATWHGDGTFTLAGPDCGVWLTSYVGVDHQLTPSDYSHPQIAKEWAWVHVTPEPTVYSVALPACDNVQVDVYTGELQRELPHGDLGNAWIAGGVIERPGLECGHELEPTPTTPAPEPTEPEETPSPTTTPAPEPSAEPTEPSTEPSTPASPSPTHDVKPSPSATTTPLDTLPSSSPSTDSSVPLAASTDSSPAATSSSVAPRDSERATSLAYTGSDDRARVIAGLGILVLGAALALVASVRRRLEQKR